MEKDSTNKKNVEEPSTVYNERKQQKGIGKDFDFDKQFAKGLTIEEAKAEMHRRIKLWKWEK